MKKINFEVKHTILVAVISFVLCTLVAYFSFNFYESKKEIKNITEMLGNANEEIKIQQSAYGELQYALQTVIDELSEANVTIADLKGTEYKFVYIGDFKITHYCAEDYNHICGNGNGITATGTQITVGKTIAVDPKIIPYGTTVYIEGYGWRVAEDCGGGVDGNHIDVAVENHNTAMSMGVKHKGVWLLVKKTS